MFQYLISVLLLSATVSAQNNILCYWMHGSGLTNSIDAQTCTHIMYSFASLDSNTLLMRFDGNGAVPADLAEVKALKQQNANLKIMIALGGAGAPHADYGKMVLNAGYRANFIKNAITFLNNNGFDGLDFDWEYPACPGTNCDSAHAPEKQAFASLLKEMRAAVNVNSRKLLLSAAVSPGKWLTDSAYDYPTMASALDFINVMTYDNAGSWMSATGHHSGYDWSTQCMTTWAANGVPKSKLLLGIPYYGVKFTTWDANAHGLNTGATAAGYMLYKDICQAVKNQGWTKNQMADGPIAYQGSNWVGYDNPISAAKKAKWVRDNGFGGVLVWEVGQDDVSAQCCKTAKPMTKALGFGLLGKGTDPSTYGCE